MKKTFSINAVSKASGIVPHTIRTWEKRYQAFRPERSSGGQRIYSEDDYQRCKLIAILLDQGHAISSIANLSLSELDEMVQITPSSSTDSETIISINRLFNYLSNYEIESVIEEIEFARINMGTQDFIFKIVLPTLQELGSLVAKDKLTVTQEHIVSNIIRDQLGLISLPNQQHRSKVVLATPDGNMHELAIIIANVLCRSSKVPTSYFGASNPANCLAEAMNFIGSDILILGVISSDAWSFETDIIPYLTKIDKKIAKPIQVYLGGGYELDFPKFKNITQVTCLSDLHTLNDLVKNNKL